MVAAAFVVGCFAPAMAADKEVSFYGNVRMDTFWVDRDKNTSNALAIGGAYTAAPASGLYDDTDVWWDLCQGCSRFGARFKAGDVSANVEIRPNSASYYRQWWGAWNFGPGSLLVGQTWAPTFHGISNSVYDGGDGAAYGECGGSLRAPMIQFSFPFEVGKLRVAFLKPEPMYGPIAAVDWFAIADTDYMLPKIEVSFDGKAGPVGFGVFGGYNSVDLVNATDRDYGVDGYYAGIVLNVPIGPAYIKADAFYAQNPREYGLFLPGNPFGAQYYAATDTVEEVEAVGFMVLAGMKFTDMLAFEAGYGYAKIERDNLNPAFADDEDAKAFYYIQMPITLAKGVSVTPEIGKFDEKDHTLNGTTQDDGDAIYYGAYWRIDF